MVLMFCLAFMTSDNDVTNGFGFGRNTKHVFFYLHFLSSLFFFWYWFFLFLCFSCVLCLHFSILVFLDADFSFLRHSVSKGGYSIFVGRALGGLSPLWVFVFLLVWERVSFFISLHFHFFSLPLPHFMSLTPFTSHITTRVPFYRFLHHHSSTISISS